MRAHSTRRLLDIEVTEAPPLRRGVDAHAVKGVHGVGRREFHPAVGIDHDHAVAYAWGLLGPDILLGIGEIGLRHHVGQTLEHIEVGPLVHARRPLEGRQRDPQQNGDDHVSEANRDRLDRDLLPQNGVMHAAAGDLSAMEALGCQGPLRLSRWSAPPGPDQPGSAGC